jgi:peptidoglycan/xylan/chitin deacetylase (PgdA/CDA1 family)
MPEPRTAPARAGGAVAGTLSPLRALLGGLSPAGLQGRLSVLAYHRVLAQPDPLLSRVMDVAAFRERMQWLREYFTVLPLDEAVSALARGTLPARAAAITFDDGYADNATVALPALCELGLTATFFVSSGYLDGGRMWNDTLIEVVRSARGPVLDASAAGLGRHELPDLAARRRAIGALVMAVKYLPPAERRERVETLRIAAGVPASDDVMMTSAQVRALAAAGMGIGAHTLSHPILARIPLEEARREIEQGRERLEAITGRKVSLIAYPNGVPDRDYRREHVGLVRGLGFAAAFSTARGAAGRGDSPFELPRFTPWDRTRLRFCVRMAMNLRAPVRTAAQ